MNPVWPCAMVGAASCLAGFTELGVIIHGSCGCYNYAEMAVPDPLNCTYLVEEEIVFGTEERLRVVAEAVSRIYDEIAVINTCVPSIMGEDISEFLDDFNAIIVDLPGFLGDFDNGYKRALDALDVKTDREREGINIEGICSIDPFAKGNLLEAKRLLNLAGLKPASVFCHDTLASARTPAEYGISANPDYSREGDTYPGSILGLENLTETFEAIQDQFPEADIDRVIYEAEEADERITKACDKFLRRNDPPAVTIFATGSYTDFSIGILKKYLDAEICFAGIRNQGTISDPTVPSGTATDIRKIREKISGEKPDLIVGSSFEHAISPTTPFIGMTFPQRSRVMLHNKPLAGIEGSLAFIEDVLNSLN